MTVTAEPQKEKKDLTGHNIAETAVHHHGLSLRCGESKQGLQRGNLLKKSRWKPALIVRKKGVESGQRQADAGARPHFWSRGQLAGARSMNLRGSKWGKKKNQKSQSRTRCWRPCRGKGSRKLNSAGGGKEGGCPCEKEKDGAASRVGTNIIGRGKDWERIKHGELQIGCRI